MDGGLNVVIIVVAILVACEIMLRLPFPSVFLHFLGYVGKAKSTLCSKKISDHWKEKILPVYARKIFMISLKLFAFIMIVLSPLMVIGAIGVLWSGGYHKFISSLPNFKVSLGMPLIALAYITVRKKLM